MDKDHAIWLDAQDRVRTEIRRLDDVADDLRSATRDLRWRGPGAVRFRSRTERRLRELADQRALLALLLSAARRAANAVPVAIPVAAPAAGAAAGATAGASS